MASGPAVGLRPIHHPSGGFEPRRMQAAPAAPQAPASPASQHLPFLQAWSQSVQPRITQMLAVLGGQEVAKSLVLAQVWTYLPVLTEGKQMLRAEEVCLIGNQALQEFHSRCCHEGVPLTQLGPMGKVWESGVVQVVQNAENLSSETHPCNRLQGGGLASAIGEIVYVPIYDRSPGSPAQGVVAVVELMMNARTTDVMVVANIISTVSQLLSALALALSSPAAAAAPASGSGLSGQSTPKGVDIARRSAPPGSGLRGESSFDTTNANNSNWAGGSRSYGSGGRLARAPSVRALHSMQH